MVSIIIDPQGGIRHIYDDSLIDYDKAMGVFHVKRASFVEPRKTSRGWQVDLSPVGGPSFGPFHLRKDALAAEIEWLERHNVPEVTE